LKIKNPKASAATRAVDGTVQGVTPTNALRRYHICRIVGSMTHAKKLYLIAAGAIVVFLPGTASAQLGMPGVSLHDDSRGLDPEEQTKRKAVDDAYKATMEKIPDQKNQTTLGETSVRQRRHLRSSEMG
jgi:hypothetical protein